MIYNLRKKMIWICGSAVVVVFTLIFLAIYVLGYHQLNQNMDMMADRISEGNGVFRPFDKDHPMPADMDRLPGFFTEETPYSTRFFTVWITSDGVATEVNLESVSSVKRTDALAYAKQALELGEERGWLDVYRYKIFATEGRLGIVFVDGGMNRSTTQALIFTSAAVLVGSMIVILAVILVVSKRVVRPIAQSYEKQTQFITDANHDLKTPLTLILTNLDIVEAELGHSEWLDDMRSEGQRMSALVSRLTALSRLDEDNVPLSVSEFSFSDVCCDTVSEFMPLIEGKGLTMTTALRPDLTLRGDEGAIRQLVTILLDNAVKYCDPGGEISLTASCKRQTELRLENTCAGVDSLALDRLFDRFYRADKARTAGTSFGIGLSLAKSIVEKHHGEIRAYKAGPGKIGFKVTLK